MNFTDEMISLASGLGPSVRIPELFDRESNRWQKLDLSCGELRANLSRNAIPLEVIRRLVSNAERLGFVEARQAMFDGVAINVTEDRSVEHTHSRHASSRQALIKSIDQAINLLKLEQASDVLVVGIGGSILGPRLVNAALSGFAGTGPRFHYIDNLDTHRLDALLTTLNARSSRVILISKSFSTQETLTNGQLIRDWFDCEGEAFFDNAVAVSARSDRAEHFGFSSERVLSFSEGVGGRFSIWSSVGLPIACSLGVSTFEELLDGAAAMDGHFLQTPLDQNLPFMMALVGVWYRNVVGAAGHALVPYDDRLECFVPYLQQLDMESNGKSVNLKGQRLETDTGPISFGGVGTGAQHAFFQWLHQGSSLMPVDFIGVRQPDHQNLDAHELLMMNLLSQSESLMNGISEQDVLANLNSDDCPTGMSLEHWARHRSYSGNRPSNLIFLNRMTARSLGQLIALYEHKIFSQGWMWGINSFDQWGVELGKQRCRELKALSNEGQVAADPVTREYMSWLGESE